MADIIEGQAEATVAPLNETNGAVSEVDTSAIKTAGNATTEPIVTPVTEYDIEGVGKVKVDDIKEWQRGHMRQSDYTKKTQDIARQKNEIKDAMEVYSYLKANPQIAQSFQNGDYSQVQSNPALKSLNPQQASYQNLEYKFASMELDNNINMLKAKYPDFNEVEVLTEADRMNVGDLEFVYNALQGKKLPTLKQDIAKEVEKALTDKIRKNGIATDTIISQTDKVVKQNHGLNDEEVIMASKMGLTPEQYAKYK